MNRLIKISAATVAAAFLLLLGLVVVSIIIVETDKELILRQGFALDESEQSRPDDRAQQAAR